MSSPKSSFSDEESFVISKLPALFLAKFGEGGVTLILPSSSETHLVHRSERLVQVVHSVSL